MSGKSVIVTGANGLLGQRVVRRLVAEGWSVFAACRRTEEVDAAAVSIPVDFASDWDVNVLPAQLDAVVHLAQSRAFREFPKGARDVFRVNVESTARLLDYARHAGVTHFVYASSGGVYGNGTQAFAENSPIVSPGQLGFYLGSKASGEILAHSYASLFNVLVIRPFFMYGAGQNRGMLIPRLVDSVREGKPVRLQGTDGIRINPVHVDDAAAAAVAALRVGRSATFNLAGPDVLSIRQICDGIGRAFGVSPVYSSDPGNPQDLIADISAMKDELHPPALRLLASLHQLV